MLIKENAYTGSNRITEVDILRGICMIAIVIGHMGVLKLKKFVYVFHLPVFFILSGYFFESSKNLGFGTFVRKKVSQLIVPYYMSCIPIIMLYPILEFARGGHRGLYFGDEEYYNWVFICIWR